jgi:selenocysteine-specific elongation factor
MDKHFILATAGHVDHGKSSLVKALTGVDPDRLPEEKARGITIDLGFAYLHLSGSSNPDWHFHLGMVDVPGHEDFVKNMVAGVGSVDVALMVVAADDGWMPQTEEHLQILSYLGVCRMVIALTKIDLPGVNSAQVSDSIRQHLRHTPFEMAAIVPVSSVTLTGIDELKGALVSVLSEASVPRDIGKPRLAVDRAFALRGIGTVVTGTLTGGTFQIGQGVLIQPAGKAARIRSIQSHNQNLPSIGPGTRTALNLADTGVHSHPGVGASHEGVGRGDVVTLAEFGQPVSALDVLLTRSHRLRECRGSTARPLKDGTRVRVHHGSGNWPARVQFCNQKELVAGEAAIAQLRFETPIFAFVNDRFIVRDWPEQATLAGGIVLDDDAGPQTFRDAGRQAFLAKCTAAVGDPCARLAAQIEYAGLARRSGLLVKSGFSTVEAEAAVGRLAGEAKAMLLQEFIVNPVWWAALRERAMAAVDAAHRAFPDRVGLPISELRLVVKDSLVFPEATELLLASLLNEGFVQVGTLIKRRTHRPELPPQLQACGARLRSALALKPLEPPSRHELAKDSLAQQALRFLIETGEVVELGSETVLLRDAFASATELIKAFLRTHRSASVSELRQAVGTSRRIMVPLLERLDQRGVTLRQGDQRVLRSPGSSSSIRTSD